MDAKWHDGDLGNRRGRSSLGQVGWTWRRFWFMNRKVRSVERLHTGCARRSCDKKVAKRSVCPCIVEFNDQIASAGLIHSLLKVEGMTEAPFSVAEKQKRPGFFSSRWSKSWRCFRNALFELTNPDIHFAFREFSWRSYTATDALATSEQIEIVDAKDSRLKIVINLKDQKKRVEMFVKLLSWKEILTAWALVR